jgi:hypothetical protein
MGIGFKQTDWEEMVQENETERKEVKEEQKNG